MDDNKIVDLYLSRDESAIKLTSEMYGKRIWRVANNIVGDKQTADECENDTYLEAWRSIPPHEPRDYLFAFLARIARHIALDMVRKRDRLKRSAFICELSEEMEQCIPSSMDTDNYIDSVELSNMINDFLATIDEDKRNIFVRRYWFMDSIESISKLYGLSQGNVKSMLLRIRAKLKRHLEKEGYKL